LVQVDDVFPQGIDNELSVHVLVERVSPFAAVKRVGDLLKLFERAKVMFLHKLFLRSQPPTVPPAGTHPYWFRQKEKGSELVLSRIEYLIFLFRSEFIHFLLCKCHQCPYDLWLAKCHEIFEWAEYAVAHRSPKPKLKSLSQEEQPHPDVSDQFPDHVLSLPCEPERPHLMLSVGLSGFVEHRVRQYDCITVFDFAGNSPNGYDAICSGLLDAQRR
jgi:hypothetical protein